MKNCLFLLLALSIFAIVQTKAQQASYCDSVCVESVSGNPSSPGAAQIRIFNGSSYIFNYPLLTVIDTKTGDTIGNHTNPIFYAHPGNSSFTYYINTTLASLPANPDWTILLRESNTSAPLCALYYPTDCAAMVGMREPKLDAGISIYPNPAANQLNVELGLLFPSDVSVVITDIAGKRILEKEYPGCTGARLLLDISNIGKGLYFISVFADVKRIGIRKFIKTS
jgi:hypothetical protein